MGSNSVSIFGANPYIQRTTKNIFGVGSTIEALTDDIIVELLNVRAAATGDIVGIFNLGILTVPGAIVIDGVALNILDRVLLQQQANPVENGVYQVLDNSGPSVLARTVDFQPNIRSSKVLVSEGDTLECTLWFNDKDPFLVLNVDPVKFVQDDGSGGGGGGDVTDATNVGGFNEVYKQKVGTILEFRTLEAGVGINITENPDSILITNTGGAGTSGRIAFSVTAIEIVLDKSTLVNLAYLAWDQSQYNTLTDGRVTFYAEIGDQELTLDVFDNTAAAVIGTLTTAGTGAYTFNISLPVADTKLILRGQNDGLGSVPPQLFGTAISFQQ